MPLGSNAALVSRPTLDWRDMPYLYLVRHGQPDFTGDYDSITALGRQQSSWLGQHLRARGLTFARVVSGTLRRQVDTCSAIVKELDAPPVASRDAGCNEYDHASLLHFFEGDQVQALRAAGDRRGYFLAIRHAMQAWSSHEGTLAGGETWREFGERIVGACTRACDGLATDANVLVVTSGGVIGRYVASVLQAGPDAAIQLNLQTRNTGVTEVVCPPGKAPRLLSFNAVPHLEQPDRAAAVTFS